MSAGTFQIVDAAGNPVTKSHQWADLPFILAYQKTQIADTSQHRIINSAIGDCGTFDQVFQTCCEIFPAVEE